MKNVTIMDRVTARMGDMVEELAEKVINSSLMTRIEEKIIGEDYMPKGRLIVRRVTIEEETSDRLCKCPEPIEGSTVNRIVYCAVCQGVIEVIS